MQINKNIMIFVTAALVIFVAGMYVNNYTTTRDCAVLGKFRSEGVVYRCKPVEAK